MRQIPEDNLSYPVLLTAGESTGSGFFLNAVTGTLLITAKHVLYDQQTGAQHAAHARIISYPSEHADTEKNIFILDLQALSRAGEIKFDATLDVVAIRIGIKGPLNSDRLQITPGVTIEQLAQTGVIGVGLNNIRLFDDVMVSNNVFILGYPISLGLPHIPQLDYSKPLIRAGVVAGKNNTLQTIVLDCPVYPGNSGGPVVEVEQEGYEYKYRIIGVVIQYVPTIAQSVNPVTSDILVNSGYSVAASMNGVLALAQQFQ